MKRHQSIVIAGAVAIIFAATAFLLTWEKRQRLGEPGLRVVDSPIYGIDVSRDATNTFLAGSNSIYLPEKVLDYQSLASPVTKVVWDWLPRDTTYGQRSYRATNGFSIQTMAVLMGKDRTSIHQPQYCVTGSGWRIAAQEETVIAMDRPTSYELPVVKLKLHQIYRDRDGREHEIAGVLVYWFVADAQLTADHRERMWWMARDLLRKGVLQRWAYITQFSVCAPGHEEATFARISEFIRASVPEYQLVPAPSATVAVAEARTVPK
jgi:hypothetical protein